MVLLRFGPNYLIIGQNRKHSVDYVNKYAPFMILHIALLNSSTM